MTLKTNTRLGPYQILALVGAGGMGEVYRARDTRLNRDVAIKILPPAVADRPARRARFAREARSISQLSHPNICTIHDVGEEDGIAFLVMEYIEGESLDKRLRLGPLPWALALEWAIQIADAIEAAHRRGIVHRDLKPGNIMVAESGVKLLDFGLAKLLEGSDAPGESRPTESITAEQKILGTLHYMSPEQLEGREVDPRTDVFAFGVTLYEMATGRKAFDGTSAASVSAAILTSEPAPVSSSLAGEAIAPTGLDHVIRRALAKHPDDRWQTARDMMLELRWLKDGRPRTAAAKSAAWRGPRWLALGAGAAAVATVAGALGWWVGSRQLESVEFWSPDSTSVGFYSDKHLKRVRIHGGTPIVIAEFQSQWLAATENAVWSQADTIVFQQAAGLFRVKATGGANLEWLGTCGSQTHRFTLTPR